MSNISNRHQIVPFIAGKSEALSDQRLSKIGYKSSKNSPAKFASVCASIPSIPLEEIENHIDALIPYIKNLLESAQDGIIKSLYESSAGQLNTVSDDDISVAACIGYLESESTGGRLTKESIENWFDSTLRDTIIVLISEKYGIEELEDIRITQSVNSYRGIIASLSGGKTLLTQVQITNIRKVLNTACNTDDAMYIRLIARLDGMSKKNNLEELLEL